MTERYFELAREFNLTSNFRGHEIILENYDESAVEEFGFETALALFDTGEIKYMTVELDRKLSVEDEMPEYTIEDFDRESHLRLLPERIEDL